MSLEHPSYCNSEDRQLYDKLFYNNKSKLENLTEEEQDFCKTMYHFEEYACGLDGD